MFALPLGHTARLRPLEPWHAQEFLAHIDRARPSVDPWIPWATLSTGLASATAVLQRYADKQAEDSARIYGIWLDGTLVGGVMFTRFDRASGVCEIGCWLEAAGEGRGLVTRACRALIDWAFTERGMNRVEWWVSAGNTRSIEVARRLGMTRDGVLRQRFPHQGVRHDSEVWSVLAGEWPPGGAGPVEEEPVSDVKAELDRLMHAFLGAFATIGGSRPNLHVVREVFIPQGTIVSNVGDEPVIYDLDSFIEPREKLLTDGTVTEFSEWEVAERTEIFGSVAHRFSEYRKSGVLDGKWFEGSGRKTTQFLRTPVGWRMSSMAWDDEK
ncbi:MULTISPECIES: GNAT family N-acetyltransferase [unclassified Streptomyces]|uniref:GNAT family N-acetyltransferase n=2 Tax=Streptomyces TaxID=1883 RepID=UPI00081B401D|nr:GNAT family protein [Streptomyces sp. DvalAA-43]MYQ82131.1 GNAT family N-acetyltransferase [Streptomyces sp. SID4936]SCD29076.1 Protein N-acetyltransferase, RimJ/RimL family [Streptomyces sp. DvalAA-43]